MLKFIKHNMETIGGIELYPLISFTIFFIFFVLVTILVFSRDKKTIRRMANMPLENDDPNESNHDQDLNS